MGISFKKTSKILQKKKRSASFFIRGTEIQTTVRWCCVFSRTPAIKKCEERLTGHGGGKAGMYARCPLTNTWQFVRKLMWGL